MNKGTKLQERKKNLVLVTRNFPPVHGGMERLNENLAEELARHFNVEIMAPHGAQNHAPLAKRVVTCPTPAPIFLICAIVKAIFMSLAARPRRSINVVIAGSGVSAPPAFLLARMSGARFGVYLHGLDIVVNNPFYRAIFLPIIRKADFWFANSSATKKCCMAEGIPGTKISVINPGVSSPNKNLCPKTLEQWRKKEHISEGPILISVGRLTRRKGIKEFILYSLPTIVSEHKTTTFVVAGAAPKKALLKNNVSLEELEEAARTVGLSDHVKLLGAVSEETLSYLYKSASAHVFPIIPLKGDMEGFGMVAVESSAWGVPTVAFAEGGVTDAVREGVSGFLVTSGDYTTFTKRVCELLSEKNLLQPETMQAFADQFQWEIFGEKVSRCILEYV